MRSMKRPVKSDPAPSRWAWRRQRLMLTPTFRFALRAGIPVVLTLAVAGWYLSDADSRAAIRATVVDARNSIAQRPEFMVNLMAIDGSDSALSQTIRDAIPFDFPRSSFDFHPADVRALILELSSVKNASVRIRPGGVLQVDIVRRVPVAIWRTADGLSLVDAEGATISKLTRRSLRPDLPVIAGEGASAHLSEALQLVDASASLGDRLRGVVRMGERRWDVVLDRNQRILLPTDGAVQALERAIMLETTRDVLSRDIARVDLRLEQRPTVRMNATATEEWRRIRQLNLEKR
ncbi:cell division protein FtsQ/DivIB [Tateyamaria sp.]|nr:cell division protein FtsQ/DivIB [Tateyamaria sp.]